MQVPAAAASGLQALVAERHSPRRNKAAASAAFAGDSPFSQGSGSRSLRSGSQQKPRHGGSSSNRAEPVRRSEVPQQPPAPVQQQPSVTTPAPAKPLGKQLALSRPHAQQAQCCASTKPAEGHAPGSAPATAAQPARTASPDPTPPPPPASPAVPQPNTAPLVAAAPPAEPPAKPAQPSASGRQPAPAALPPAVQQRQPRDPRLASVKEGSQPPQPPSLPPAPAAAGAGDAVAGDAAQDTALAADNEAAAGAAQDAAPAKGSKAAPTGERAGAAAADEAAPAGAPAATAAAGESQPAASAEVAAPSASGCSASPMEQSRTEDQPLAEGAGVCLHLGFSDSVLQPLGNHDLVSTFRPCSPVRSCSRAVHVILLLSLESVSALRLPGITKAQRAETIPPLSDSAAPSWPAAAAAGAPPPFYWQV